MRWWIVLVSAFVLWYSNPASAQIVKPLKPGENWLACHACRADPCVCQNSQNDDCAEASEARGFLDAKARQLGKPSDYNIGGKKPSEMSCTELVLWANRFGYKTRAERRRDAAQQDERSKRDDLARANRNLQKQFDGLLQSATTSEQATSFAGQAQVKAREAREAATLAEREGKHTLASDLRSFAYRMDDLVNEAQATASKLSSTTATVNGAAGQVGGHIGLGELGAELVVDAEEAYPDRPSRLKSVAGGVARNYASDPANTYGGVDPAGVALDNMERFWPKNNISSGLVSPIRKAGDGVNNIFRDATTSPASLTPGAPSGPIGSESVRSPSPGVDATVGYSALAEVEAARARETQDILDMLNPAVRSAPRAGPNDTPVVLNLLGPAASVPLGKSGGKADAPGVVDLLNISPRVQPVPAPRSGSTVEVLDLLNPPTRK